MAICWRCGAVRWPLAAAASPLAEFRGRLTSSGAPRSDTQPVAVRVHEVAFPSGQTIFVDWDPELVRDGIDVLDVQMDQGVRPSVARVLRQVKPNAPTCHRDEPGEAGLELVLPLFRKSEPLVPRDRPARVLGVHD